MPLSYNCLLYTSTAGAKLKELVIVRTSQINKCEYCLNSHTQLAHKYGWSEEQIADLANFRTRTDFTAVSYTHLDVYKRQATVQYRNWAKAADFFLVSCITPPLRSHHRP